MITVFVNEDGYYVTGENVDVTRRCSPALTVRGDRIFQVIHHVYKVLFLALCEIRDMNIRDDIMVYNDSRIVDEINGLVEPLDTTCDEWLKTLNRHTIPSIKSVVFFRKKPTTNVNTTVNDAHTNMLVELSGPEQQKIAERETKLREARTKSRNHRLIDRLKNAWFGENNG
jgi:hypothetical protein